MEIELESPLGETSPLQENPRIKVVIWVVMEIQLEIEPESPLGETRPL